MNLPSLKRMWVIFVARNREFYRDQAGLGWNLLFPFLIIVGFGVIFGGKNFAEYKIGVFPIADKPATPAQLRIPERFKQVQLLEFVPFADQAQGLAKLKHHRIDLLLKAGTNPPQYWISEASPKGYIVEKLLLGALQPPGETLAVKEAVAGRPIRYLDWLFPGILGMNMMFSTLWGVGYVVVRYRKNGVLKRLKATPLRAFEYLTAQALSRLCVLFFSLVVVWIGCDLIFSFQVAGSYLDLAVVFLCGGLCLIALGLLLASRGTSEEMTSGILNFISWPMMFLSEVWFSLEGAPDWVKAVAKIFPLTHMITAARKVMNAGAGLGEVRLELIVLLLFTVICLTIGARLFSWNK